MTFIEVMPMEDTDISRDLQFVPLDSIFKKLNERYNFNICTHNYWWTF